MSATQVTLNPATQRSSLRAAYSKHILHEHLLKKLNKSGPDHHGTLPAAPKLPKKIQAEPYAGKVCIIGAGVTGLFIGMLLKYVGITDVDIFEGNNRVGGRLYTHHFPGDTKHNYYDVGAMRVPEIPWMQPTLQLMRYLDLDVQPYIYKNPETNPAPPVSYWYRHEPVEDDQFDDFMQPIVSDFAENFQLAFTKWLTTDKDNFSTRAFLMAGPKDQGAPSPPWTYDQTAHAELYDTSTGLFDQSFTETVIDYTDFQNASKDKWWRVEGGCELISDAMESKLADESWPSVGSKPVTVTTKSRVVALFNDNVAKKISVTVADKAPAKYDMVFNTTAMAPLQQMDLQGLELPDNILTGIRSLSYDRATKVAIKFSKAWWNPSDVDQYGGYSSSDLPIRTTVYPSWNDGKDYPTVLIVSYTWAQDATRMASLVQDYNPLHKPSVKDPIVKLCLENLVKLWSDRSPRPSFQTLAGLYESHHAWGWENDPWTGGAYALFGPGQFKNVYPQFQHLYCQNKFAMCGEALSSHHAWISGSLDSAYIKTIEFLLANNLTDEIEKLREAIFGGGPGGIPEEMDDELVKWTILLGEGGGPKGWGDELKLKKGEKV